MKQALVALGLATAFAFAMAAIAEEAPEIRRGGCSGDEWKRYGSPEACQEERRYEELMVRAQGKIEDLDKLPPETVAKRTLGHERKPHTPVDAE